MTAGQGGGAVALITGGASGIGAATARRLAGHGWRVVVADLDTTGGAAVAEECGGLFVATDVASPDDNERAAAYTVEEFGRLDAAVLNAAIAGRCGLDDFTPQRYRDTLRTDLDGVVYGLHAARRRMREQGGGRIVVTGSIAGLTGSPDVFYATAKHALIGLVRSAAPLLEPDRIRLNTVCPGLVDTPALASTRATLLEHGLLLADPDEVAAAIETVLADERTGHAWSVQAGRTAEPIEFPGLPLASR
ncbi:SDR family NAD(P)-dependent oxidoreductase [Streptomyces noursei]|uniref:SDR family NAD(P)-dependent oxidoreductase n=1 Tax=Streptomyces noursei TaxID=1971 RepID=UPI0023B78097|nr:SDR family oxidoreductase [Streptomyces noursei]